MDGSPIETKVFYLEVAFLQRIKKSAKWHRCYICENPIKRGSTYYTSVLVCQDLMISLKICEKCLDGMLKGTESLEREKGLDKSCRVKIR